MGTVYKATQVNLNRKVAIKVLFEHTIQDQDFLRGFFREAQAAAAFTHQNIVQAYDVGQTKDDLYYFAMELVDGGDVLKIIEERGSIIYKDALPLMTGIAEGLHYGNSTRQLTHGDLKPANILIAKTGEAKLADLGLARMGGEIQGESDGIMLTPMYAAPEMILDQWENGDPRADIYSFGASLYHMLAGHPPFQDSSFKEILRMQVEDQHIPLKKTKAKIPQGVSDFVDHLLEKDLKNRPQNWQEVINTLRQLQIKPSTYQRQNKNPKSKVFERASEQNSKSKKTLIAVISAFIILGFIAIILIKIDYQKNPLDDLKAEALKDTLEKKSNESVEKSSNEANNVESQNSSKPGSIDSKSKKKNELTKSERKQLKEAKLQRKINKTSENSNPNKKTAELAAKQKVAKELAAKQKVAKELAAKQKTLEINEAKLSSHLKALSTKPRKNFFSNIKKISEIPHPNPYFNNLSFYIYEACKAMSEIQSGPIYIKSISEQSITFIEEKSYGPLQTEQDINSISTSNKLATVSSHIFEKNLSNDKNVAVFYALTHPEKIVLDKFLDEKDKHFINYLRVLKANGK